MNKPARGIVGVLFLAGLFAGGVALLNHGIYGFTIFIVSPVLVGAAASWIFRPRTSRRAVALGAAATAVLVFAFLLPGLEGLICVVMALPLAVPLGALGAWLVYQAGQRRLAARGLPMLLLLPAASMMWDVNARPPVFEVRTAIEIAASPEHVWKHVVAFSELPEPREWFFRTGLAYPRRARIVGSGVGAVRYCEFSTGPFVEPIEVWDEPRLLRFRVTENPAPMRELSFYSQVLPKHLHGYLVSKEGQFRLTPLANGHTLLEGTTWYQHGLWPAEYWRLWSDAIIHRIHLRVLNHVRALAEREASDGPG